ncbi:SseB family protein [Legionella yabuuchiae]|uniref:SseB family protein n=1 Tax=Legionella yabuuchiae TaxID=376727 RepID=UPI0010558DDF|nr:SseB family protein [Legionella yabuuchiae]
MNELETAILNAFQQEGAQKEANKAYLEFIKANFIIPIEADSEADPKVLYCMDQGLVFLPVFSNMVFFDAWANDIAEQIKLLRLSGVDLLKGIGDEVTVCLNIGSSCYKEFNPAELARMRSMVLKFFNK